MNTKIIVTSLMSAFVLGATLQMDTSAAELSLSKVEKKGISIPRAYELKTINKEGIDETELDPSTGWEIVEFSSDLPQIVDVNDIFKQNGQRPGTDIKYATTNFFNMGNSYFEAQRVFHLKKGNTYNFDLIYGLNYENNALGYTPTASINFNGNVKELTDETVVDEPYKEKVVVTEDQDYVITIRIDAPRDTGVFTMVGFNSETGGITPENSVKPPIVKNPEANQTKVTGQGQTEGNLVKIFDADKNMIGEGKVDEDLNFSLEISRNLIYKETLQAIQYNAEGDVASNPTEVTVVDTVAPGKPTLEPIQLNVGDLVGKSEPNAHLTIEKGGQKINEVDASKDGSFALTLSDISMKDKYDVYATDEAGNNGEKARATIIDTISPEKPSLNEITTEDHILSGTSKEPNLNVVVNIGSEEFTGKTNEDGSFEIDLMKTYKVGTKITAYLTDESGNSSEEATTKVVSKTPTEKPLIDTVGDSDSIITGSTEPLASITVLIEKTTYKTKADKQGNFTIEMNRSYPAGTKGIAKATGISGVDSESVVFTVIDNTNPDRPTINRVTTEDKSITGTAEPLSEVTLLLTKPGEQNPSVKVKGTADENGYYRANLPDGEKFPVHTKVDATAKDQVGNVSDSTQTEIINGIELDVTILDITSQDLEIVGKTSRPGSNVHIEIENDLYDAISDKDGNFTIELKKTYQIGTKVYYSAKEDTEKTEIFETMIRGRAPYIINLNLGESLLKGTVETDAEVHVIVTSQDGTSEEYIELADSEGNFSMKLKKELEFYDRVESYQINNGVESLHGNMQILTK